MSVIVIPTKTKRSISIENQTRKVCVLVNRDVRDVVVSRVSSQSNSVKSNELISNTGLTKWTITDKGILIKIKDLRIDQEERNVLIDILGNTLVTETGYTLTFNN